MMLWRIAKTVRSCQTRLRGYLQGTRACEEIYTLQANTTVVHWIEIQLQESPIPTTTTTAAPAVSQKASSDDISGTKRGTIDPLVSKRPEKNYE